VLRLGSEPRKGEPFGSFLDAGGKLWATGPLRDETT